MFVNIKLGQANFYSLLSEAIRFKILGVIKKDKELFTEKVFFNISVHGYVF